MQALWEKYSEAFNARELRERVIICACVLAAIYGIWSLTLYGGLSEKRKALEIRYKFISNELKVLNTEEQVLSQALVNNPNTAKKREIQELQKRVEKLDKELQAMSAGLIAAEKLPMVIRDVLVQRKQLQLLGLHVLPPASIELQEAEVPEQNQENQFTRLEPVKKKAVGIFKHSVVFRVKGEYFDILNYLNALQNTGWVFYWSALEYSVSQYPEGIVQLEAYTLSTDRGFISE